MVVWLPAMSTLELSPGEHLGHVDIVKLNAAKFAGSDETAGDDDPNAAGQ